jgi:hypothetical protein
MYNRTNIPGGPWPKHHIHVEPKRGGLGSRNFGINLHVAKISAQINSSKIMSRTPPRVRVTISQGLFWNATETWLMASTSFVLRKSNFDQTLPCREIEIRIPSGTLPLIVNESWVKLLMRFTNLTLGEPQSRCAHDKSGWRPDVDYSFWTKTFKKEGSGTCVGVVGCAS